MHNCDVSCVQMCVAILHPYKACKVQVLTESGTRFLMVIRAERFILMDRFPVPSATKSILYLVNIIFFFYPKYGDVSRASSLCHCKLC